MAIPLARDQHALATVDVATADPTIGTSYRILVSRTDDVTTDLQAFGALYAIAAGMDSGDVTVRVQGSPDNSAWYDLASATVGDGSATLQAFDLANFVPLYVRAYIDSDGPEYTGTVYLTSNASFSFVAA